MESIHEIIKLNTLISEWKKNKDTIALVPTMGSLHFGHIFLIKEAKKLATRTVVSIFVNPIQFGQGEDYESYPSNIELDKKKLKKEEVDIVFVPDLKQLYPMGTDTDTRITVPYISEILCGQHRPGHFSGVATVVAKLLVTCKPDFALFGKKDYQQYLVIKRMVSDLLIPTQIVGLPTQREKNGLALSSRNKYLSEVEQKIASKIYLSLQKASEIICTGVSNFNNAKKELIIELEDFGMKVEYFELRRAEDLALPEEDEKSFIILIAVWLGKARLIDNITIDL